MCPLASGGEAEICLTVPPPHVTLCRRTGRPRGDRLKSTGTRRDALLLALAVLLVPLTALVGRPLGPRVRLDIGAFEAPLAGPGWSRSDRAELDEPTAGGDRPSFYFRALPVQGALPLPVEAEAGPVRITLRGTARMRSAVGVFFSGTKAGEVLVVPGPWARYSVEAPSMAPGPLDLSVAVRPLPLVRRAVGERPDILVDYLEVESPAGLRLTPRAAASLALAPLLALALLLVLRAPAPWVLGVTSAAAALTLAIARHAPLITVMAVPRLAAASTLAGLAAFAIARTLGRLSGEPLPARALAVLVAVGVIGHGSVAFFPDHSPPDLDIHVRRTLDLRDVPLEYGAWMRYGSQLPTASQDQGAATAALGERTLIPYSPLPYVVYYALAAGGLDLYWALTALNAALVLLVVPILWGAVRRFFDAPAAWLAALLYTLDLAVWHHLGRVHAPAVFGGALATAALLGLAWASPHLDTTRRAVLMGAALAAAVLGYSSLVVLVGLFGAVLLLELALDARGLPPRARAGVACALAVGGLLALVLFYGHYVPGMVQGARGVEAEPDLFPGRTFFIFHNESRQAMRLWALGLWIPLAAGLVAAPIALRRAPASARPVLVAWLAAWVLILVLKEPRFFPRLLRWAKEDQFVSPLMCVLIAGATGAVSPARVRWGLAALLLAVALWLQLRDFGHHSSSLLL
jgi:hypothetical protein